MLPLLSSSNSLRAGIVAAPASLSGHNFYGNCNILWCSTQTLNLVIDTKSHDYSPQSFSCFLCVFLASVLHFSLCLLQYSRRRKGVKSYFGSNISVIKYRSTIIMKSVLALALQRHQIHFSSHKPETQMRLWNLCFGIKIDILDILKYFFILR